MFVWWCLCGVCVVLFVCGVFVVVFLWWCSCGCVFVVVFVWWCVCVCVWWCFCACGGVFCAGVVVFVWWCFCGGLTSSTEAMLVLKDCHRTTDAGKVVELSVTRHHTASLVWLMRKFSVWNFHGSKVYARDMKN